MLIVCAWCQETPDHVGSVSHSICEACFRREMESLEQGDSMREVKNWYIKDTGDGRYYISGMAIPRDADGVTRNINFVGCDFHPASNSKFENCQIDGKSIPDGEGCLWKLEQELFG